jgi:anti-anti-sigma factor
MDGHVTVIPAGDRVVVRFTGHVDAALQHDLDAVRAATDGARVIDVDLRGVRSFYSVGIAFLLLLSQGAAATGATVRLIGPAPLVRELLVVTELHELFEWVDHLGADGP